MGIYTFYADGLNIEVEAQGDSEAQAHRAAWAALTDEQRNACACLDCVDERPAA